ncbi:conserved protein of unknown function [Pseudodesulfovibrio profundus]|uniref:Uncharacterized protein n=1 Tax=Pseudodesulfovibrio profundus TaxID=57320 RepID=A0A2C8F987_9BACT|nr:hypothetical protein [Pseudodesulfovibrio profundus]MBC17784.1 hypothetical protein [Desulfovibrio sp.]SOB59192.1 conserved protein of unknown function [Pseudodesulfovibrio profundus]|tara:strand:- start:1233 stop:1460 length:228 start_codon:yes stop_codon:yes gene_type:complete
MRTNNNLKSAAQTPSTIPFAGLGMSMKAVRTAAQAMTALFNSIVHEPVCKPVPDTVTQPSGYSLLVTLGREIRGR